MNLPLTQITPLQQANIDLAQLYDEWRAKTAFTLQKGLDIVTHNEGFTSKEFWTAAGPNAAAILQVFGGLKQTLVTFAPELVTDEMRNAGSTLIPNPDGTIS
jgi:hypothetical protein